MAWTGLNLTVEGRAALNKAQTDKHLNFKSIVVGDGNPPGNFSTVSRLVHQLYELTDLKIDTTDAGCMLTADLPDVDYDYYMREIGVIVTTDDGEKLYVYDNCGSDAQYIVSTTEAEKTQKRIRLSLLVSDVKNITVSQPSILYVAYDDFENAVDELEKKKVDISGGDISDTVATLDETAGDATDNIASGESLRTILSKVYKVIRQFFIHKSDTVIHTTKADKDKLAGIEEHANNYVHPDTHPAGMITSDANHRFVTDDKIAEWSNSLGASKTYTDGMYRQATAYADKKVADLIGGAPESLDTLKEVADAIKENKSVMDALDAAVGKKANQSELDTHVDNSTIHITSQEREKWNGSVSKTGDASNTTVTFTESTRVKPTSGEKLSTIVGKIVKWLADLKAVAFSGSYSDLTNTPASLPANGGTSDYANFINIVAGNEIRFNKNNYSPGNLFLGYCWSDGSKSPSLNNYIFGNMSGGGLANITANEFIGSLAWKNVSGRPGSLPASDVYSWAKQSTKPLYTWDEIKSKPETYKPSSHDHESITGKYIGDGGQVSPSYIGTYAVKCNMMNGFKGLTTPNLSGYMDVLMMNAYSWSDVPYATALGIRKAAGGVRAWIANGIYGAVWNQVAELLTSVNFTEYAAPASHTHRSLSAGSSMLWVSDDNSGNYSYDNTGFGSRSADRKSWTPVYGSSYPGTSSKRYKTNIASMTEDRARKILELNIVSYDYIEGQRTNDRERYNQVGVIAEEADSIIPEAVFYKYIDGIGNTPDSVDYSKFVPYLIKMVQMQQQEIDELKRAIQSYNN